MLEYSVVYSKVKFLCKILAIQKSQAKNPLRKLSPIKEREYAIIP
jgi:hypothetical protein